MNLRSQLYAALRARIKSAMAVAYVASDRGQAERPGAAYPLPLPAALIRLGEIRWANMSGVQEGSLTVEVRLYVASVGDDHDGSESDGMEREVLEQGERLWSALEGWSCACCCGLNRRSDRVEWKSGMAEIAMTFATKVTAAMAAKEGDFGTITITR